MPASSDDRLLLTRNELYGLATRYESYNIPIYAFLNRLLLLFQSSAVFVICWEEGTPARTRLFHHFYDPIARPLLDQFLIDAFDGWRGDSYASTTEIFCPNNAFEKRAVDPVPFPLQRKYRLFLVAFKADPDDRMASGNLSDYFEVAARDDPRHRTVAELFGSIHKAHEQAMAPDALSVPRFVFGKDGARLEEALDAFEERHRPVNMDARSGDGEGGNEELSARIRETMDALRRDVIEPILKDIRPSPLIQLPPAQSELKNDPLPFSNLFFVVRIPYDHRDQVRYGEDGQGLPYTLQYLIPETHKDRIRRYYRHLANTKSSAGACRFLSPQENCALHDEPVPCLLNMRPKGWDKTLGEYEKTQGERSIVDLIERPFGADYRSAIDTAIALGTIFFADAISPDGAARVYSRSPERKVPLEQSLDKLRFYATACLFHQISGEKGARLMAVPIQVAGTHYACAVSVLRKNDNSNITWLRTFHFYTMIMSRVVARRFRRDIRSFYLDLVENKLVNRFDREASSLQIAQDGEPQSVHIDLERVLEDTTKEVEIITRRIPYNTISFGSRSRQGQAENAIALEAEGSKVWLYFRSEEVKHFPHLPPSRNKQRLPGESQNEEAVGSYLSDRLVREMLERSATRMIHLLNKRLDYLARLDGAEGPTDARQ